MTVSPNRTMLPPIWVAACDSQRRRNPPFRKTARRAPPVVGSARRSVTRPPSSGRGRRRDRCRHRRVATDTNSASRRSSAPLEEDVAAAGLAAQADVGAEPIDEPGVAAARVGRRRRRRRRGAARGRAGQASAGQRIKGEADRGPGRGSRCRRQLEPIDRGDGHDDVRLGRRELGDDPARAGQRACQLVGRADRLELEGVAERPPVDLRPGPAAPVTTTPVTTRSRPTAIASAPALRSSLMSSSTPGRRSGRRSRS